MIVHLFLIHFSYQNVVKQISPKNFPKLQGRIVNGNEAESKQFPYQVSLRSVSSKGASICGGSIISSSFVLTAAHCTKGYSKFEVGVGSNNLNKPKYKIISIIKTEHPQFDPVTLANVRKKISASRRKTQTDHFRTFL